VYVRCLVRSLRRLLLVCLTLLATRAGAAGGDLCGALAEHAGDTRLAILSAFPAELAPLVARTTITERIEIGDRRFYVGELAGVRVVLVLTGIGLDNAAATTSTLLASFDVAGIVFSGVAGSPRRIGDVTVPLAFTERAATTRYRAEPRLLALARSPSRVRLSRCTVVPASGQSVCLRHRPRIYVGGVGHSDDSFGGPLACFPGGDDVFGCDLPQPVTSARARTPDPVAEDMETAAVARVAASRGVPWVAFRAVSDGAGDPLDLPGFPGQFFAYYRLAAANAAESAVTLVTRIARAARRPRSRFCRMTPTQRDRQRSR
jgi:nucleoside phosphorylase